MKTLTLYFLLVAHIALSQTPCDKYTKEYVPENLNQAIAYFNCSWSTTNKTKFKQLTEAQMMTRCHLGIDMWLRNSWGLWKRDSKIYKHFDSLGVKHPEDISSIILRSYHRYLNKQDIRLKQQIAQIKQYWQQLKRQELAQKRQKLQAFNIQDTVEFAYKYEFVSAKQEQLYDSLTCIAKGIVLAKDTIKFRLRVKLIESCDNEGIIIEKYDISERVNGKWIVVKKDHTTLMKVEQILWTPYDLWEPKEE